MTRARVFVATLVFFAIASMAGLGFAVFGPVALIRIFGATALVLGLAGAALQLYALHLFSPAEYLVLRNRIMRSVHRQPAYNSVAMPSRTVLVRVA